MALRSITVAKLNDLLEEVGDSASIAEATGRKIIEYDAVDAAVLRGSEMGVRVERPKPEPVRRIA